MIYKRGCNKKGLNGTCSKCGERGACGVYWYKFMWQGSLVRESSKQGNDKVARKMESAHRTKLALGEVGIREKGTAPTLRQFLEKEFLPFVDTKHASVPNTRRYYHSGADMLLDNKDLAGLLIDQITDQHGDNLHRASRCCRRALSTVDFGL